MQLPIPPALRRLILYALCGASGVTLDFLLFSGLVTLGVWYQAANLAGYAAGTLLSFFLNRAITFGVKDNTLIRLVSFVSVAGIGFLVSTVALWVLVEQVRLSPVAAKLASLVVVLAVQFTLNSLVTFRQSRKTGAGAQR